MVVYINWKTKVFFLNFPIKITIVVEVSLSPYFINISMQNLCNKFSNSNKTTIAGDFCYFCSESVPFRVHSGCRYLCRYFRCVVRMLVQFYCLLCTCYRFVIRISLGVGTVLSHSSMLKNPICCANYLIIIIFLLPNIIC